MKNMVRIFLTAGAIILSTIGQASAVTPVQPHDFTCVTCHTPHKTLGNTGYDNICLSCHRGGDARAGAKSFAPGDAADPFGRYTSGISNKFQISHRWDGSDTRPDAGALPPVQPQMTSVRGRTSGALACVRCHNPHLQDNKPFLRMANDADQMCLDCHRSRNTADHTQGTHPVGIDYQQKASAKPSVFNASPVNANPSNPTSAMKLIGGKVSCSTCHGVHATDSNSSTFDSFSSLPDLKTSDGSLLRTDHRSATAGGINICSNCHAGKVNHNGRGQNIQCADCHGAHVDAGDGSTPNVWLVKRDMGPGKGQVFFNSTTVKNYMSPDNFGVCQSCHAVPTGAGYQFHLTQTNATCNGCHAHSNGTGSFSVDPSKACNACHGYPPLANSAGAGGYAAGYQASPSFTDESVSGHGSHASAPYQKACINCHNGNNHQDGVYQDVFNVTAGTVAATGGLAPVYDKTAQTCSNVYCHSNANPRGGTNSTKTTPSWNGGKGKIIGTSSECGTCHSAAGDPSPTWSASHTKHINGYGANPNFTCAVCHARTASGNSAIFSNITARSLHTNGVKDVVFNSFASGGTWDPTSASCSNLYCHSNVQGAAGVGAPTTFTPVWNGAVMTCGSCHASMVKLSNISTATGSHKRHVQGYGFDCSACHGTGYSVTNSSAPAVTHVDGVINIGFTGTAATNGATPSYYQGNNFPGGGYKNCSNTYCHSTVQGSGGLGKGAPTAFAAPVWGAAPLPCGSCHANMATSAAATGSHFNHTQTAGFSCPTCHNGAGKDPNPPFAATAKHADGTIEISFSGSAVGAVYSNGASVVPGTGFGTCSTVVCHGSATLLPWGGTLWSSATDQCGMCHSSSTSGAISQAVPFYSTSFPTKVTSNTDAKVGAHTNHMTSQALGISASTACTDCHGTVTLTGATHMNGSTTFAWSTLATKNGALTPAYTAATGACANVYCHGNSMPGGDTTGTNKTPTWINPNYLPATLSAAACGTCHGFPPSPASGHPVVTIPAGFPATVTIGTTCSCHANINTAGNSYANIFVNPALHINGILEAPLGHNFPYGGSLHLSTAGTTPWSNCTGCHTNAAGGTYPVAAGTPPNCTGCHLKTLRVPSGTSSCWDCHGASATDGKPTGNVFPNISGNHAIHVALAGATCATCHTGGGNGTATHGSSNQVAATPASVKVVFTGQGAAPLWTFAVKTCSATNCHGQGSPTWGARTGALVNGFPYSSAQCDKCHSGTSAAPFYSTAIPKVTANTDAKVGAHTNHMTSQTLGISASTACTDCHGTVTLTGATHMNGSTTFVWSNLATKTGVLVPAYTAATGTCANVYCHGNSMPGGDTTGSNKSPIWNDPNYLPATLSVAACGTCHGFPPSAASGHPVVTIPAGFPATVTIGTTCSCHANINQAGNSYANIFVNPALHINGILETPLGGHSFPYGGSLHLSAAGTTPWSSCTACHTNAAGGTYPVAVGTAPNCTGCHLQTLRAPSGTSSCWDCHGASATDGLPNGTVFPNIAKSHSIHAAITGTTCATCHTGGGTTTATHGSSNRTAATAATVKVGFTGQGASPLWTFATNTCSATNCHGQGAPTWGATSAAPVNGFPYSAVQCDKCHSGTATAPFYSTAIPKVTANTDVKVGAHTSHLTAPDSLTNAFTCADCHGTVTLTSATHMNGTTNFTWSTLATKGGTLTPTYTASTSTCANVYCHGASMPGGDVSGTNRAPTWNSTTYLPATISAAACGTCHGFPPLPASGHPSGITIPANFGNGTVAIGTTCSCHSNISTTGTTYANIFVNKALHINGIFEPSAGGHAFPYSGSSHLSAAGVTPWSACSSCHNTTATGVSYATWASTGRGTAPNCTTCHIASLKVPSGTSSCYDCHGASATDGKPNGGIGTGIGGSTFPNYSGSHTAHISKAGLNCANCHFNAGAGAATHGNSNAVTKTAATVTFNGLALTPTWTSPTCTVACHAAATWGSKLGCIDCHAVAITRTKGRPGTTLAAVTTEFGLAWGHKKTGRGAVTDDDCIVCHLEGNASTHKTSALHGDGNIDLRDPDGVGEVAITNISGAAFTFQRFSTSYAAGSRTTTGHLSDTDIANVITQKFCLACHDSNGALNTTARSGVGTAAMPWGGIALGATYTALNNAIGTQGLIDVKTQLATTNSSRHPVLGSRTRDFPYSTRLAAPYNNIGTARDANGTSGHTTAASVVINCFDCHNVVGTPLTTRTVVAHGNAVTLRGTIYASGAASTLCTTCHTGYNAAPGTANFHGPGSAWAATGSSHDSRINCQSCHGSNTGTTRPARPLGAQDYHGNNALVGGGLWTGVTPNSRPYAFIRGWTGGAYHRPYRSSEFTTGSATCGAGTCPGGGQVGDGSTRTYTAGGTY